ncbi:OCIA domain-containing protein 1-like [Ornithodoros turicata]|uniref:OCIA domain-containing protein 1-like n=1 Tax=Ornithodoros turicata TaxID=34597 RepID=UPI003139527B
MAAPSDVVAPELGGTGYDAQQRRPGAQYRITMEEMRAIKDCNRESFYYRCLPFASAAMLTVHYAVKVGYLSPHPRLGSSIKVIGAGFVGWLVGKLSYQRKCEEKLMALPGSAIGEALRRKYGLATPEGFSDSQAPKSFDFPSSESGYSVLNASPSSGSLNLDVEKNVHYQGLDDSQRPSLDNEPVSAESEIPPAAKSSTSYDELRRRNREEYERRQMGPKHPPAQPPSPPTYRMPPSNEQSQASSGSRSTPSTVPARSTGNKKNEYGDTWDE